MQRTQVTSSTHEMQMILPAHGRIGALHLGSLVAARNAELLLSHGIEHVYHLMRPGWVWEMDLEELDMYSTMIPLNNKRSAELLPSLDEWVDDLHSTLTSGRNVLVHCGLGDSRSASLIIAYMIKYHGLSFVDAYHCVVVKRSQINLQPGFPEELRKFEMICCIRDQHKEMAHMSYTEMLEIYHARLYRAAVTSSW